MSRMSIFVFAVADVFHLVKKKFTSWQNKWRNCFRVFHLFNISSYFHFLFFTCLLIFIFIYLYILYFSTCGHSWSFVVTKTKELSVYVLLISRQTFQEDKIPLHYFTFRANQIALPTWWECCDRNAVRARSSPRVGSHGHRVLGTWDQV